MPVLRPFLARLAIALIALAVPSLRDASAGDQSQPTASALVVVARSYSLDREDHFQYWQVDYRLRNDGVSSLVLPPSELSAKVEGWVSNSRVADHAVPRRSSIMASGSTGLTGTAEIIPGDELQRCRERLVVQAWPAEAGEEPPDPIAKAGARPSKLQQQPALHIAPGGTLRVRLRLEHEHFLYGPYNALLGPRTVELRLGAAVVRDSLPLDRERHIAQAPAAWPPTPPPHLLDTHVFVSAPDSLHLDAHIPGNLSHRFPERPVRYATTMRLRFWYLIARGSEGEYRARIAQYKDSPNSWKTLSDGEIEQDLGVVGRWTRVDRLFRTEPEATSLSLDFRIVGTEVGELWIDDISLEPVGEVAVGP